MKSTLRLFRLDEFAKLLHHHIVARLSLLLTEGAEHAFLFGRQHLENGERFSCRIISTIDRFNHISGLTEKN